MSAHTPGPWRWVGENMLLAEVDPPGIAPYDCTIIECGDDGKPYGMHSAEIVHNADDAMAEANRRLIAAAPELLSALREFRDQFDAFDPSDKASRQAIRMTLIACDAAIAKATGAQP